MYCFLSVVYFYYFIFKFGFVSFDTYKSSLLVNDLFFFTDLPRASRRERAMRRRERRSLNASAPPSLEHVSRSKALYQQQLQHADHTGASSSVYQSNFQRAYENLMLAHRVQKASNGGGASQLCTMLSSPVLLHHYHPVDLLQSCV